VFQCNDEKRSIRDWWSNFHEQNSITERPFRPNAFPAVETRAIATGFIYNAGVVAAWTGLTSLHDFSWPMGTKQEKQNSPMEQDAPDVITTYLTQGEAWLATLSELHQHRKVRGISLICCYVWDFSLSFCWEYPTNIIMVSACELLHRCSKPLYKLLK